MKGNILEAIIGAVVLIIASIFLYFAYVTSGEKIKDGYILVARFDDVTGLTAGADIKLNGIKVGIVKSLKIDNDYQARSELLIKSNIKIPDDSSASIATEGIIGSKFIAISPGFSENKLKQNEEIEMTKPSVNLEKLIGKFIVGDKQSEEKSAND